MKKTLIEIDGQKIEVWAQKIRGACWVHLDGETLMSVDGDALGSRKKRSSSQDPSVIVAPMPGKVTKILLQVGDSVKIGQVVLVMEAMKMEYSLKAARDGVIENISAAAGEQVRLGQALMQLEKV